MSRYGRARGLQALGQGLLRTSTDVMSMAQKKKERDVEEKRYQAEAPKRELELEYMKENIASTKAETVSKRIEQEAAEERKRNLNKINELLKQPEYRKVVLENPDVMKEFSTKVGSAIEATGAKIPPELLSKAKSPLLGITPPPELGGVQQRMALQQQQVRQDIERPYQTPPSPETQRTRIRTEVPIGESYEEVKPLFEREKADIEHQRNLELLGAKGEKTSLLSPEEMAQFEEKERIKARLRPPEGGYNKREQVKYKAGTVDAETEKAISGVYEASSLLSGVIDQYKTTSSGVGSIVGETVSKVPLAGKYMAPKSKEYDSSKKIVSEVFLRAATGAAAPDPEVARYASFLPDLSDPQELAQKKLDNFKTKVMAKAGARVKALNAAGDALIATGKENYIEIGETKKAMAQSFMESLETELATLPNIVEKKIGGEPIQPGTEEPSTTQGDEIEELKKLARGGDATAKKYLESKGIRY